MGRARNSDSRLGLRRAVEKGQSGRLIAITLVPNFSTAFANAVTIGRREKIGQSTERKIKISFGSTALPMGPALVCNASRVFHCRANLLNNLEFVTKSLTRTAGKSAKAIDGRFCIHYIHAASI